jgi:hypothetical protein
VGTKHFILIGSLPGGGKTYLAKLLQKKWGGYLIDDPKDIGWELINIPMGCDLIFITDPFFCLRYVQKLAEEKIYGQFPDCAISWIFLENNADQCRINVAERNDGRKVEGSIRRFSREFYFPGTSNSLLLSCYTTDESFRAMVERIEL